MYSIWEKVEDFRQKHKLTAPKTAKSLFGVVFRPMMCCVWRQFLTFFKIEYMKIKTNRCEQIQLVKTPAATRSAGEFTEITFSTGFPL